MFFKFFFKALEEVGLVTLWSSPFDTKLLCLQRFVRLFGYGSSTLILVSYLSALEISKSRIGLFMTLTLIGSTVLSFILTIFADAVGRRAILLLGAVMMTISGVVFALVGNYWVLLVAAVVGVISPSGNEIGPFRSIEESTIAQLTPESKRGDIYAWYSLLGAAGSAFGMGGCGWMLGFMVQNLHWESIRAYRMVFFVYAGLGVVMICIVSCLSKECEAEEPQPIEDMDSLSVGDNRSRNFILSKVPSFSRKSKIVVVKLCALFALESFGSNLVPLSWITYFFHDKFGLPESKIGTLFFITTIVAAISMLFAAALARRFGNIKTMVFAHLPSAVFLSLIPAPQSAKVSIVFLVLRSCTQSMDTPPRSAFLAGVVEPHERTTMMGLLNISRSSVSSFSPLITGMLAGKKIIWVAFVLAGSLLIVYDLGILAAFGGHRMEDKKLDEESDEEGKEAGDLGVSENQRDGKEEIRYDGPEPQGETKAENGSEKCVNVKDRDAGKDIV
ncbi:major facilitator superfamily domain-containing protein [Rhexocercosporidium sp. MPI-PUGE-AT-0058]|nr:major facilitator superfamily domain-containing protein [Rhexocercosporidium sp. MPI-PUGE-AT-0058]